MASRIPTAVEHAAIEQRAAEIYESLRAKLEPKENGKFLVIDVDSCGFELDDSDTQAALRARRRFPKGRLFAMRVGERAAYRIGSLGRGQ